MLDFASRTRDFGYVEANTGQHHQGIRVDVDALLDQIGLLRKMLRCIVLLEWCGLSSAQDEALWYEVIESDNATKKRWKNCIY
jgi:hypothetical protein